MHSTVMSLETNQTYRFFESDPIDLVILYSDGLGLVLSYGSYVIHSPCINKQRRMGILWKLL